MGRRLLTAALVSLAICGGVFNGSTVRAGGCARPACSSCGSGSAGSYCFYPPKKHLIPLAPRGYVVPSVAAATFVQPTVVAPQLVGAQTFAAGYVAPQYVSSSFVAPQAFGVQNYAAAPAISPFSLAPTSYSASQLSTALRALAAAKAEAAKAKAEDAEAAEAEAGEADAQAAEALLETRLTALEGKVRVLDQRTERIIGILENHKERLEKLEAK